MNTTIQAKTENWCSETQSLNSQSLQALFDNKIGAIRLPNFASASECDELLNQIDQIGWDYYENVDPPIAKVGVTQFEHRNDRKFEYFRKSGEAREKLSRASVHGELLRRVESLIRICGMNTAIAMEDGNSYFAGLVREINTALLHVDFAPLDGPTWSIGRNNAQLAWNLYVKTADSGGECVVHNRQWTQSDENYKELGSYGYGRKIVADVENIGLHQRQGDLTIFNSRNFHEVLPSNGRRVTLSSFIGRTPENDAIFWS